VEQIQLLYEALRQIPVLLKVIIGLLGVSVVTTAVVGSIIALQLSRIVEAAHQAAKTPPSPPQAFLTPFQYGPQQRNPY
jgi:hypothetical protein